MTRVKRGVQTRRKHNKVLKKTKGYRNLASKVFKWAKRADMKAGQNEYMGRKLRKRDFRRLWITRINAACKQNDINYSRFTYGLLKAKVKVDRKMLAELAVNNPDVFSEYVKVAKTELK